MTTIFETLSKVDRRIWYFLLFILVGYPLLRPIGLPLVIGEEVKTSYNIIDNLEPGSIVLVNFDVAASGWDELKGSCNSLIPHLFEQEDVKIIFMTDQDQGFLFIERTIGKVGKLMEGYSEFPWYELHGKRYLEDYINIGFFPGRENAIAALASDFRGNIGNTDFYGLDIGGWLDENGVNSAEDIDLVVTIDCAGAEAWWVRHWYVAHNTKILNVVIGVSSPSSITHYNAGMLVGLVISTRGAAEYQYLSGYPGMALISMDAFSIVHFFLLLVILIGNIGYYGWERKQRRRE